MSQPVVIVADPLPPQALAELGTELDVRHCCGADREALLAAVTEADALIIRSATQVDREVLTAARRLRIVARAGVGLDNVDLTAAAEAGVTVANAPESNIVSVAELTVGLVIASLRNIPAAAGSLRARQWRRSAFEGAELYGKTVGILGFGRVGRLVARRLAAFEMTVEYHDPYVAAEVGAEHGARGVPLDELMRNSDVLTVHLPRTPETVGLVGEPELRLAKPSMLLVNTARGGIVDEYALARALKEGRVRGAALDVCAGPFSARRPLSVRKPLSARSERRDSVFPRYRSGNQSGTGAMSIHSTERKQGRKSTAQRWNKMLSKLATVVGILALAVTVWFGSAAQSDPVHPSAEQRVLANGTGPGNAGS